MATRPNRQRSSRAAVLRRIAELEAQASQPRELSRDLQALIAEYRHESIPEAELRQIRPFIAACVLAAGLTGRESVRKHRTHLAELAAYARARGLPLDVSVVLTTTVIDDFVRVGLADATQSVKHERRRRLLWMATNANPGPDTPARMAPLAYRAIQPCYDPSEIAAIRRAAVAQPSEARGRDLKTIVGLGAGAGLDSQDFRHLRTTDIHDLGDDGVLVAVPGPRPRMVIVRREYEEMVRDGISGRVPGALVLGEKEDRRNLAARPLGRAAGYRLPDLDVSRLRATWLADLMTDPIPLAVILNAAGLKSARSLADLLPHLGPWLELKGMHGDDPLRGA